MPFKTIFKYYWLQIRKHKWAFFGVFAAYGAGTLLGNVIVQLVYREIIDTIIHAGEIPNVQNLLSLLLFQLAGITVLYNIFYRIGDYTASYFQAKTIKNLTDFSFRQIERHSYGFFANTFSGGLVAKVGRFVRAGETMFSSVRNEFAPATIVLLGIFVIVFRTNSFLGWYFLLWLTVFLAIIAVFVWKKIPLNLIEATEDSKVTARLSDFFTNILNVKMFAAREREVSSFERVTKSRYIAQTKSWSLGNFQNAIQATLIALLEVGGMYVAIKLWLAGSISGGTVVLIQIYTGIIWGHVWNIGSAIRNFSQALSDAAEMVEIFEQPVEVTDPIQPEVSRVAKGKIVFQNISFGYNPTNPVLKNFTLTIHPGERVGLVGSSGAGKTTITKLLLRFADPQSGAITIDGQNIAHITQDDLRRSIAYVPQDPVLFHRSLKENIAYGTGDAVEENDDEAIISAAKKAHAHEFISGFPEGYETLVGERGVKLSGGERQRVAIARAILKNAPILVLDEATSSLDTLSEKYIQEGLEELMRGKTVIVVAHRLSTVRKMDRIVVLGERGIEEEGTHDALVSLNGKYASFWKHQTPASDDGGGGGEDEDGGLLA